MYKTQPLEENVCAFFLQEWAGLRQEGAGLIQTGVWPKTKVLASHVYNYKYNTMLSLALCFLFVLLSQPIYLPPCLPGLGSSDLATVYEATITLQAKWHDLGLALRIPPHELDATAMSTREPKEALKKVLKLWLDRADPRPTWQALASAAAGKIVDQGSIAADIARQYCPEALGKS